MFDLRVVDLVEHLRLPRIALLGLDHHLELVVDPLLLDVFEVVVARLISRAREFR